MFGKRMFGVRIPMRRTGFVLNQPAGLGDEIDPFALPTAQQTAQYNADLFAVQDRAVSVPSSPTSSGSIFGNLFSALTSPATVTATLNKYVFGKTAPIPTATNVAPRPVASGGQYIAGVPNSYLLIGGLVAAALLMTRR